MPKYFTPGVSFRWVAPPPRVYEPPCPINQGRPDRLDCHISVPWARGGGGAIFSGASTRGRGEAGSAAGVCRLGSGRRSATFGPPDCTAAEPGPTGHLGAAGGMGFGKGMGKGMDMGFGSRPGAQGGVGGCLFCLGLPDLVCLSSRISCTSESVRHNWWVVFRFYFQFLNFRDCWNLFCILLWTFFSPSF